VTFGPGFGSMAEDPGHSLSKQDSLVEIISS
jgi:hypothetical protein